MDVEVISESTQATLVLVTGDKSANLDCSADASGCAGNCSAAFDDDAEMPDRILADAPRTNRLNASDSVDDSFWGGEFAHMCSKK